MYIPLSSFDKKYKVLTTRKIIRPLKCRALDIYRLSHGHSHTDTLLSCLKQHWNSE
jgi:hypothetical protein